ncbi:MAG: hypothetical protein Q9162_002845 [Coniocarpon cinnabarinum]
MAQPMDQSIKRDPALFWWILLPITLVMVLTGILRHYLTILIQTPPKPVALPKLREQRHLMHAANLRANASVLPPSSFNARRAFITQQFRDGKYLADPDAKGKPKPNPMTDPSAMEGMMGAMKGNVAMMVPQTLIMGWINAFFSGFVLLKLPFPLTPQFKSMLQSGVGTRDLDVRWVSSLSWYFLTLFGLQPVYNFILGGNNTASQVTQQMQMMQSQQPGMNMFGGQQDEQKLFDAEAENLEVLEPKWVGERIEERLLRKLEAR